MPGPFDPVAILRVLAQHDVDLVVIGGTGARLLGTPLITRDVDVMSHRGAANLEKLAVALRLLGARLRISTDDAGVEFPFEAKFLAASRVWTLTTDHGDLDVLFEPTAMDDYDTLAASAFAVNIVEYPPVTVLVAPLASIIRSKEAANRPKDKAALHLLKLTQTEIERRQRRGR